MLAKYGKATPEALVDSALWEIGLFEEHGFTDIKISVKRHDPVTMVKAYRLLASKCDYPLHLGVTEAGPQFQGTIKSATAFGILLSEGIGDTIRVSLSAPPVEEVKVGISILESLNLRQRKLEIVSCPSCGRAQVDVYTLAKLNRYQADPLLGKELHNRQLITFLRIQTQSYFDRFHQVRPMQLGEVFFSLTWQGMEDLDEDDSSNYFNLTPPA